jgi:membrane protein YqaA with SNARE-associated domain
VKLRRILLETAGFFLLISLIYLLLFLFFRPQLEAAGRWTVDRLGLGGVFVFVLVVDCFIVPATADLLFPITVGWNPLALLLTMSAASILGGFAGFLIAGRLAHVKAVQQAVAYYRYRGEALIKRFGVWAVVIAGFTPVPYSTVSWIAGMAGVKPVPYLLASLSRIPRFFLYYAAIRGGLILVEGFAG